MLKKRIVFDHNLQTPNIFLKKCNLNSKTQHGIKRNHTNLNQLVVLLFYLDTAYLFVSLILIAYDLVEFQYFFKLVLQFDKDFTYFKKSIVININWVSHCFTISSGRISYERVKKNYKLIKLPHFKLEKIKITSIKVSTLKQCSEFS